MRSILCHSGYSHLFPVLADGFLSRCKIRTPSSKHMYSSISRLYAQNAEFKIVQDENGNVSAEPSA